MLDAGGGEVVEFLSFEEPDDGQPPAPDAEDFPVGCEAELVDMASGRVAQSELFWEAPVMDLLFRPRRRVKVIRHSGDYCLVQCPDEVVPDVTVCITLQRACLKEAKMRFGKYDVCSDVNALGNDAETQRDLELLSVGTGPNEQALLSDSDDDLSKPVFGVGPIIVPADSAAGRGSHSAPQLPLSPPAAPILTREEKRAKLVERSARLRDRGSHAFKKGNFDEAVKLYTRAIEYDRTDAIRVLSNRSAAHLGVRNARKALGDARLVIKLDPLNPIGFIRAGNAWRHMGNQDVAARFYQTALDLSPEDTQVQAVVLNHRLASQFTPLIGREAALRVEVDATLSHAVVVAKRSVQKGAVLAFEEPLAAVGAYASADAAQQAAPHVCACCARSLVPNEAVHDYALQHRYSLRAAALIQLLYRPGGGSSLTHPPTADAHLPSSPSAEASCDRCGAVYCSKACKERASATHWIDCRGGGKWGRGLTEAHDIIARHMGTSDAFLIAAVRLTIRVVVALCGSGKALQDAMASVAWLRAARLSDAQLAVAEAVLRPAYDAIHTHFSREEQELLPYAYVQTTFARVVGCSVVRRCTPWGAFLSRAETSLDLARSAGQITAVDAAALMEELRPCPPVPGLLNECLVVGVLSGVAIRQSGPVEANAIIRPDCECTHMMPIIAAQSISKGGRIAIER